MPGIILSPKNTAVKTVLPFWRLESNETNVKPKKFPEQRFPAALEWKAAFPDSKTWDH